MKTNRRSLNAKIWLGAAVNLALLLLANPASAQWSTNGTNVFYNGGNVGIGTDTPMTKLHVVGNIGLSNDAVIISNADWSNYFKPYESATGRMVFRTGATDRMSILYNGNVGIGFNAPASKLQIVGTQATDVGLGVTVGPLYVYNTTNNADTTGLQTAATFLRIGKPNVSYSSVANWNIGRYSQSGFGGNTQMTLRMVNGNTTDPDTDVMTWLANGKVGIGTTSFPSWTGATGAGRLNVLNNMSVMAPTTANEIGYDLILPSFRPYGQVNGWSMRFVAANAVGGGWGGYPVPVRSLMFFSDTSNGTGAGNAGIKIPLWLEESGNVIMGTATGTGYDGGNVGIGTAAPATKLDVAGQIRSSTGGFMFPDGTVQTTAASGGGGSSLWTTSGANIYYNSGNVGIGTTSPTQILQANGPTEILSTGSGAGFKFRDRGQGTTDNWVWYSTSNVARFWREGVGDLIGVTNAGNVGIGTVSPGAKLHIGVDNYESIWFDRSANANSPTLFSMGITYDTPNNEYLRIGRRSGGGGLHDFVLSKTGNVGIGTTAFPTGLSRLVVSDSLQNAARLTLSGQEFYQASNTSTDGVAFVLGVNRTGNRQLWIADSASLVQNSTNTVVRIYPNAGMIDALGTDGITAKQLQVGNGSGVYIPGNVGIGSINPDYKLDVAGVINSSSGGFRFPDGTVQTTAASGGGGGGGTITGVTAGAGLTGGGTTGAVTLNNDDRGSAQFIFKNVANAAGTTQFSAGVNNDAVRFAGSGGTTVTFDAGTKKITIDGSTSTVPAANISAGQFGQNTGAGNYTFPGNVTVTGTINAKYQDVAEWVPTSEQIFAGTVVVLDTTKSNQVISSTQPYDTRVAGVISAQPGIALGESGEGKVLVATTGRVLVQVDASKGAIHIGDLLVTSDLPGMAMKSTPVNLSGIQLHRPGTIIGKALEPLEKGSGKILVLLSLQ